MPNPQRRRGFDFERECVRLAQEAGLDSARAYGSDGRALGESKETDIKVHGLRGQCKRRKKLPSYLTTKGVDFVAFRPDRGEAMCLLKYRDFLNILKNGGL